MGSQCKAEKVNIVMGDLNAIVGRGRSGTVVGDFGLGLRNKRETSDNKYMVQSSRSIFARFSNFLSLRAL